MSVGWPGLSAVLRGRVLVAALLVSGCVAYDPVPPGAYARPGPGYAAPIYEPPPQPLAPPVLAEPLGPPPGPLPPPEPEPPTASAPPVDVPPADAPMEPPRAETAPPGPAPSSGDPATDLLLTPLPQRDAAQPAAPARTPAASQDPFQGFRPMRGQTKPTP